MSQDFDLVVLGSGPSASQVAVTCAEAGWKVAVVDTRAPGGTCALHGCNPKKVLTNAADLADWARRSDGELVSRQGLRIDWPQLIRFKQTFTEPVTPGTLKKFEKKGITFLRGEPVFADRHTLSVDNQKLQTRHVVIGTGAKPAPLTFPGAEFVLTSDDFLELPRLPPRVLFIGGGYISLEFACVAALAGAAVRVLEQGDRPLKGFDPQLVKQFVDGLNPEEIDVVTQCEVQRVEQLQDGSLRVHSQHRQESRVDVVDLVVHGAGRVAVVDGLNLEAAGVEYSSRGIRVNEHLQSVSCPSIYAAGDVLDRALPQLTPVANEDGRTIAHNLLHPDNLRQPDYGPVPKAVFTVPQIAAVGLSEEDAREQGLQFDIQEDDTSTWGSNRKLGSPPAGFRILVEQKTGRLLGAHLLGPAAAETINLFALAMKFNLTAKDLKSCLFVFPTAASDVRQMV